MSKWIGSRYLWGGLIVFAGIILLLQSLDVIDFGSLLWALLFAAGGAIFISIFSAHRENWWAIIPGLTLLSIAVLLGLDQYLPEIADDWGGSIVLGGIGLSFLIIYLIDRNNWWAIIPAGVLISIAVSVGLESYLSESAFVGLFFLGMGLTFAILAIIPSPQGNFGWAWIPSGILAVIGLVFLFISGDVFRVAAAAGLIVLGGYLVIRTLRSAS